MRMLEYHKGNYTVEYFDYYGCPGYKIPKEECGVFATSFLGNESEELMFWLNMVKEQKI